MPADTDLQSLVDELERIAKEAEELQEEVDDLEAKSQELEDSEDNAELKQSWELWAQSFETDARVVRLWAEYTVKNKEYNDAAGTLTEETADLFDEVENLYGEWAEQAEKGQEISLKIAALYDAEEVDEDELEALGSQIEGVDDAIAAAFEQITAKEDEIEELTPEASDEDEDEE
jgi:prefoldin subunit 5